jgi:hypothetical protein
MKLMVFRRQQKLGQMLAKLSHMAEGSNAPLHSRLCLLQVEFNVAVLMVRFAGRIQGRLLLKLKRPIKFKVILEPVPSLLVLMGMLNLPTHRNETNVA